MGNEFYIPSFLGGRIAPATPNNLLLSGSSGFNYTNATMGTVHRSGVIVTAYAQPVYLKLGVFGETAPTPSSTDYDYYIATNSSVFIAAKRTLDMAVTSAGTFSAVEVQ